MKTTKRNRIPTPKKVRKVKEVVVVKVLEEKKIPAPNPGKTGNMLKLSFTNKFSLAHENHTLTEGHPLNHNMLRTEEDDSPD